MKYCPRCLRTEADIPGCPNEDFPGMTCPDPVDENPAKDVSISCGPCDFNRLVPIRELLSGAAKNKLPTCRRDECACVIVPPEAAPEAEVTDPIMPEIREAAELAAEGNAPVKKGKAKKAPAAEPASEEPSITPEAAPAAEASASEDTPGLPTSAAEAADAAPTE